MEKDVLKSKLSSDEYLFCQKIGDGLAELEPGSDLFDKLYEIYSFGELRNEMPYSVQKARNGDPVNWLTERLGRVFQD